MGATWTKQGTPTRPIASTMPIVVSMLVVLKAPATHPLRTHSSITLYPLTRGTFLLSMGRLARLSVDVLRAASFSSRQ